MMKLSTPASSQDPSRSFIQRCSVLRRTEALPGKGRLVAVLTPYSIVGARRISSAPDRSSARRSTMMVSQPSGRWGPRSEEHTSELQSRSDLVCRLLLEKKKKLRVRMHVGTH